MRVQYPVPSDTLQFCKQLTASRIVETRDEHLLHWFRFTSVEEERKWHLLSTSSCQILHKVYFI